MLFASTCIRLLLLCWKYYYFPSHHKHIIKLCCLWTMPLPLPCMPCSPWFELCCKPCLKDLHSLKICFSAFLTAKRGRYTYTAKPYKQCIPVKNSHFFSCTKIHTNIFVESSICFYCQYTKKAKQGVLYQSNFIHQSHNSSGTLSKSGQTFPVILKNYFYNIVCWYMYTKPSHIPVTYQTKLLFVLNSPYSAFKSV